MAELKGTQVAAAIVPFTDLDTYATHDAEYGKGGFRSVDTNAKRDAIPAARKVKGMVVRVNDTGLHWTWTGSAWVEWLPKGSMVVDAALSTTSQNPVQNKVITNQLNALAGIINGIPIITVDTVWNATSNNPASSKAIESTISPIRTRVTTLETWKNGIGNKNQANGVAGLDASGKISASQLPAGYDNVDKLVAFVANAPTSGMTIGQKWYITSTKKIFTATSATSGSSSTPIGNDMIYIDQNANKSYYWSGTDMVNIGSGNALALGLTHSTAFYGDFGNILYTNFGTGTNLTGTQDARDFFIHKEGKEFIQSIIVSRDTTKVNLSAFGYNFDLVSRNINQIIPAADAGNAGVMTADMYKTLQEIELATFPLSLTASGGGTFEVGSSNKNPIGINVARKGKDVTSSSAITVTASGSVTGSLRSDKKTWTPSTNISSNTSVEVKATYGSQNATKTVNYTFKYKKYWGTSTSTSLTSSQVIALAGSTWADSKAMGATTFDCTGGKYVYYVIPSSLGTPEFWVGGLKNTDVVTTSATVTNASGGSTTYSIMRLANIQTGVLSVQFK